MSLVGHHVPVKRSTMLLMQMAGVATSTGWMASVRSKAALADLAVTLAFGGDCLADIAVLRSSPELFGPVASDPTVSRLVTSPTRGRRRCGRSAKHARRPGNKSGHWRVTGLQAPAEPYLTWTPPS